MSRLRNWLRRTPRPGDLPPVDGSPHRAGLPGLTAYAAEGMRPPLPVRVPKPVPPTDPVPAAAPRPPVVRVTYWVAYGTGTVPPLAVHQVTRQELAAEIARHAAPYLGAGVRAVIDADLPHVLLRRGDRTVGHALLQPLPTPGGEPR